MPSDKNNGFNDLQSERNDEDQQDLDEATTQRDAHLNDFLNKSLDPSKLDPDAGKDIPIPQSPMPSFNNTELPMVVKNKLSKLQQYLPPSGPQEDAVPYDPNAGTMMNIGRFALNNLAGDQLSGAMPVAGSIKAVGKLAEEAPAIMKAAEPVVSGTKSALEKLMQHFSNPENVKTLDDMLTKKSVMETYRKQFPAEAAAKYGEALGAKPEVLQKMTSSKTPYEFMDTEGVKQIDIPMIERLMGKSSSALRDVPTAQKVMHEAGDLAAETGMAGTDLLQSKAVQDNGRAMYMQSRDAAALAAKRKAAIAQALKNRGK